MLGAALSPTLGPPFTPLQAPGLPRVHPRTVSCRLWVSSGLGSRILSGRGAQQPWPRASQESVLARKPPTTTSRQHAWRSPAPSLAPVRTAARVHPKGYLGIWSGPGRGILSPSHRRLVPGSPRLLSS